jgi:hypothetical protein
MKDDNQMLLWLGVGVAAYFLLKKKTVTAIAPAANTAALQLAPAADVGTQIVNLVDNVRDGSDVVHPNYNLGYQPVTDEELNA